MQWWSCAAQMVTQCSGSHVLHCSQGGVCSYRPCACTFVRRCAKQLLNQHSLRKAEEVRKQLARACARLGLPQPESCDGDMDHLRKGIVAVSALVVCGFGSVRLY
eukprot:scaffold82335_cov27-Tisochrysis_lutea.AAC.1